MCRVFHKICVETLRDESTYANKRHSSNNVWSEIKRKGIGKFANLVHPNVKTLFCSVLSEEELHQYHMNLI